MEATLAVSGDTKVTFSWAQVISVAVVFSTALLGFAYFVTARTDANYSALQSDVSEVREWTRDDNRAREDGDAALAKSLADLTAQLQLTTAKLSDVADSLTSLDKSIRTIDNKLSASIARQQEFEKSIVARLDSSAFGNPEIPAEWSKAQTEIMTNIKAGGDPLAAWFKGLPEQQN